MLAPTEKVKRPRAVLPEVHVHDPGVRYRQLIDLTKGLEPIRTAVVHPVDRNSLLGAIDAAQAELDRSRSWSAPRPRSAAAAEADGIDLSPYELIPTTHSHEAAATAVALARAGKVEALMKGSLHTDELMHEVVGPGHRPHARRRRISHVFVMDVPAYPRPLFLTDAAINIDPDLEDKRDIVQNAIDLAQVLGIETPRVAILSAVETVSPKLRSTHRGGGAVQDGRPQADHGGRGGRPARLRQRRLRRGRARPRGSSPPVAGRADILVVPDLEAGNMLAKQLEYLAEAQGAGIVLGARVPIALTSRADKPLSRMASCAIALAAGTPTKRDIRDMTQVILVLNAGSSSVKFSVFSVGDGGSAPAVPGRVRRDRDRPPLLRPGQGRRDRRRRTGFPGRGRDAGGRRAPNLQLVGGP